MLVLPHSIVDTPVFMPVGTQATVKAMLPGALSGLGFRLILGNTYHLHLRPGDELIARAGGLHRFQAWDGSLLTDSGGFQVFSLAGLRRIREDCVEFRSHIDGSARVFTPAGVMQIQRNLGADIVMAFDECAPFGCGEEYARQAMERTHRWAASCAEASAAASHRAAGGWEQSLFGIVQGVTFEALRRESARTLVDLDLPGYAIGGLAVGEDRETRNACVEWCAEELPAAKPRYLMGVGTPLDILDAVDRGVDMFDCVLPTRNARNAQVFTTNGVLNLRNARFAEDFGPIDPGCRCLVCSLHSRSYIRHLFVAKEMLGPQLTTHHNLAFYGALMESIRASIHDGAFTALRRDYVDRYSASGADGEEGGRDE